MPRARRRVAIGIDLQWPYKHHVDVVRGILQYAGERDWRCEVRPILESGGPIRLRGRYDGVIARATRSLAAAVRRLRIPAVNVWLGSPDRTLPRVTSDPEGCSRLAVEHLRERGFRRFGFLGYARDRNSQLLLAELRRLVAPLGTTVAARSVPLLHRVERTWPRFARTLSEWSRTWTFPLGILTTDDLLGRYLADACGHLDLRIPDDVAIVGCGNTPLLCEQLAPTLTSIEVGFDRVGYRAARLLDSLMRGASARPRPFTVPPSGLIPRRSTEVFAVDDRVVSDALRYIVDQASRGVGVRDVVARLPVTRRSLERRFRKVLGRTIHEEIVRARLRLAKRRLAETDAPIKVVARESGFSGIEHLSLVFRQREGTSPGAYRRRQRTQ